MCEYCQLVVVWTVELKRQVDFLRKINEYDRLIDNTRLVSNTKGAMTTGKEDKLGLLAK